MIRDAVTSATSSDPNLAQVANLIHKRLSQSNEITSESFTGLSSIYDSDQIVRSAVQELLPHSTAQQERMISEFFELGPLTSLVQDESVSEILTTGYDTIWFERSGQLARHDDAFFTQSTYINALRRISQEAGVQTNLEFPTTNGKWRDFRLNIADSAISPNGPQVSFRRHPKNPWSFARLQACEWADSREIETLKELVGERKNILVIGPTGSGKTSVLNAFLQELKEHERVVVIEDSDEVKLPNSASSKLLTRDDPTGQLPEIGLSHLLRQALRMRPDRVLLGEIRGAEAKDLLMALSTGHEGSFGTLHASDPQQALLRLEMLIQLGAPQWQIRAIRNLIFLSLDYIVLAHRTATGQRRLGGIFRLASLEESGFLIEKVERSNSQRSTSTITHQSFSQQSPTWLAR